MEIHAGILTGAASAMASAIVAQWVWFTRQFKTVEKKLAKCEVDHDAKDQQIVKLWARVTALSTRLAMVASCRNEACPLKQVMTFATIVTQEMTDGPQSSDPPSDKPTVKPKA